MLWHLGLSSDSVRKKLQLYVAFIDFSKAYDKVPRGKLFKVLKSLGCGGTMILAQMSMLCDILGYLGLHHINSIHRWQGTPTSCFLFVMFVDMLIRKFGSMNAKMAPCFNVNG